jgi:hypothetical protein
MSDVFISYKSRMRPRVRELAQALEALGLTVWFDEELEAGRSFAAVINAELERAKCVIVCWTPDAFAPADGSEVSWVEAEASIAREQKKIVPIMLERVPLKAPWNMFHTERMMDWTPAVSATHGPWLALLEVVGRHVGRPGLHEYARAADDPTALAAWAARYPDDPKASVAAAIPETPQLALRRLRRRAAQVPTSARWMLGATAVNTIGAILLLLRVGPDPDGTATYVQFAGPVLSSAIFAIGLWRSRALDLGRALFTIMAGIIGYVAAIYTATLVEPAMAMFGTDSDLARGFINGILAGFAGSFFAAGGIALLMGNLDSRKWLTLLIATLGIGLVCGVLGLGPLHALYPSNFFFISVAWTLCYGLLLTWLASGQKQL